MSRPTLVPELYVSNLRVSLEFYQDVLGFRMEYERPEDKFAALSLGGAQLMLEEAPSLARATPAEFEQGQWRPADLEPPFGRGVNFEIRVDDIDAANERIAARGYPLLLDVHQRVYRLKLDENGTAVIGDTTQHFYTQNRYRDIVADPDGKSFYLITDENGKTSGPSGLTVTSNLKNPGTILKFTLLEENVNVKKQEAEDIFRIWPNPASHVLSVELRNQSEKDFRAELINLSGQVVREFTELQPGFNETKIDDIPYYVVLDCEYSISTFCGEEELTLEEIYDSPLYKAVYSV